jgi:hypothetical protein
MSLYSTSKVWKKIYSSLQKKAYDPQDDIDREPNWGAEFEFKGNDGKKYLAELESYPALEIVGTGNEQHGPEYYESPSWEFTGFSVKNSDGEKVSWQELDLMSSELEDMGNQAYAAIKSGAVEILDDNTLEEIQKRIGIKNDGDV